MLAPEGRLIPRREPAKERRNTPTEFTVLPLRCSLQDTSPRPSLAEARGVRAMLPQANFDLIFEALDAVPPVTVEATTTNTAATRIRYDQRTQSTPEVTTPPKAS